MIVAYVGDDGGKFRSLPYLIRREPHVGEKVLPVSAEASELHRGSKLGTFLQSKCPMQFGRVHGNWLADEPAIGRHQKFGRRLIGQFYKAMFVDSDDGSGASLHERACLLIGRQF